METLETRIEAMEKDVKALKAALGIVEGSSTVPPRTSVNVGDLSKLVTYILHDIGVPAHVKGHRYVRAAIVFAVNNPHALESITKVLYVHVAEVFGTTPSRVERAIRHAVELAWTRGDLDTLNRYFQNTVNFNKSKPTNFEFIAMLVDYIWLEGCTNEVD